MFRAADGGHHTAWQAADSRQRNWTSRQRRYMRYIENLSEGMRVHDVYLCKTKNSATTRNGKEYINVILQDKTGQIDGKIWEPDSPGIGEFEPMDYVNVDGNVTVFNGNRQLNCSLIFKAAEGNYDPSDYFPVTEFGIDEMTAELNAIIDSVRNSYLSELLKSFFGDESFMKNFAAHSAAKSVHHGFIGGLLQHTLSVTKLCDDAAKHYSFVNRDLLVTGAMLHDIGKVHELSAFPANDYTDMGQLLGHIVIGSQMVSNHISKIPKFPKRLAGEVLHMILSHHGEMEFGSPKKPALIEAMILSFADNMDAKVETMHEALNDKAPQNEDGWVGYNKFVDTNLRRSTEA